MADDIVMTDVLVRLRNMPDAMSQEAADEIEKLRAEVGRITIKYFPEELSYRSFQSTPDTSGEA